MAERSSSHKRQRSTSAAAIIHSEEFLETLLSLRNRSLIRSLCRRTPSTYVVQLPREQILRYPPPENARKFHALTRQKNRSCCRRCCLFHSLLLTTSHCLRRSGRGCALPRLPSRSAQVHNNFRRYKGYESNVSDIPISRNLTSASGWRTLMTRSAYTIQKTAPVNVFNNDVKLSDGVLPAFYQPKNNVTVFETALKGSDIVLGSAVKTSLINGQNENRVPLVVRLKVPVKFRVGSMKTWKITIKVKCDVIVDALNDKSNIVSKDCDYSVRLW
ncbi:Late embryogenesis abundant (LEA) hydroxyproline-rich glycoprotein family [Forsythia ovata]|uniref:Late embryogenesis abundant (LEA) hydroxyproline-rich glycoprotein family n=1 Tax=Forsythia ovata TaxID=205694 RepID=A0ABD1VF71_9LAMI